MASIIAQTVAGEECTNGVDWHNVRFQRLSKRAGTLIILVVDTSGSMLADRRMEMAKGCALSLLQDAYLSRNKVAVVAFGGEDADIIVPPTSSPERAAQELRGLTIGGRTPLLPALDRALMLASHADGMPVLMTVITDGKYSNRTSPHAAGQLKFFAQRTRDLGAQVLVVDTEAPGIRAVGMAKQLASTIGATYVHSEDLRADTLRHTVDQALTVGSGA